jgi:hypothetical protein
MDQHQRAGGVRALRRLGAVAAVAGTLPQVVAGSSQAALLGTGEVTLAALADLPDWTWPLVYLGFVVGALLWVVALVALAQEMAGGTAWALGRLAAATAIVGAALHAVDGTLNAVGLAGLARAWATAPDAERAVLEQNGDLLLRLLDATWAGVIALFHGAPFVLAGLAVALSPRYPAWLGWVGFASGVGSVVVGVAILFDAVGPGPAVPFAVLLSLFMVVLGWLMWTQTNAVDAHGVV